jgi:hypothetical protein
MMSRAEVRRSLIAMGVRPRVVDSIVDALPAESRTPARSGPLTQDEADRAAASVLADFERLLSED